MKTLSRGEDMYNIFCQIKNHIYLCNPFINRGVAQLASAPALGAGGPPFESEYPDAKEKARSYI